MKKRDHKKTWLTVLAMFSLSAGCVSRQSASGPNSLEAPKPSSKATRALTDQARRFSPEAAGNAPAFTLLGKDDSIVIQACSGKPCNGKKINDGVTIPKSALSSRLKAALYVPTDMPKEMKGRIDLFEKGDRDDITTMKIRVSEFQRVLADLQLFISISNAKAPKANAALAANRKKLRNLETKIAAFSGKLSDVPALGSWVKEINQTGESTIDLVLSDKNLNLEVSPSTELGAIYNVVFALSNRTDVPMDFKKIPAGRFTMGTPDAENNREGDEIQRAVTISRDFEIQTTETTQAEWFLAMGYNPSHFKFQIYCPDNFININGSGICPDLPVETVSWLDVQAFTHHLNHIQKDFTYRLPTEAEWEYAARSGEKTAYSFGESVSDLEEYAWYTTNSLGQSQPVAQKLPNNFSLYDMHGNVWEWVHDVYKEYQAGEQKDPVAQLASTNPASALHVMRGGCWGGIPKVLRSGNRSHIAPHMRWSFLGFRLQRSSR